MAQYLACVILLQRYHIILLSCTTILFYLCIYAITVGRHFGCTRGGVVQVHSVPSRATCGYRLGIWLERCRWKARSTHVHITFVTCVLLFFFHYYCILRTTRTVYQKPPIVWQVGFVNTRTGRIPHRPPPRWTSFGRFPQCSCSKQQVRLYIFRPIRRILLQSLL